jgi:diaminopimelate decarboxylase
MSKLLPFTLNELKTLENKYNTPYYIYDGKSIIENTKKYMNTFQKYFPKFKQFFAVKACPNPFILDILGTCGMGFDCSSPEEIKIINLLNESRDLFYNVNDICYDIFYTSNYTSVKDLNFVLKHDNITINFDDIDGFYNMSISLQNTKEKLPDLISFRYNPDLNKNDVDIKSNKFSGNDTKFGMTYNNILKAYEFAKDNGIKRFGIHTMCASNQLDINYWSDLIDNIFYLVNELKIKFGIKIEFINIGGGLGIPYKPTDKEINIEELVINIRESFDRNIKLYNLDYEPSLYTECGRYITGPYGYLVSSCQSIKKTDDNIFYGLDANMANLMRPGMYNAYHHITIPRLNNIKNKIKGNVVGTLCENNDWFAKDRELPEGIEKGDLFVIHDAGAHGFSMGFNYNSKLRSCELIKFNNVIDKIRDRETFDDLIHNTIFYKKINNTRYLYSLLVIILSGFIFFATLLFNFYEIF